MKEAFMPFPNISGSYWRKMRTILTGNFMMTIYPAQTHPTILKTEFETLAGNSRETERQEGTGGKPARPYEPMLNSCLPPYADEEQAEVQA